MSDRACPKCGSNGCLFVDDDWCRDHQLKAMTDRAEKAEASAKRAWAACEARDERRPPYALCNYCEQQECTPDCPTVTHPLEVTP